MCVSSHSQFQIMAPVQKTLNTPTSLPRPHHAGFNNNLDAELAREVANIHLRTSDAQQLTNPRRRRARLIRSRFTPDMPSIQLQF